MVTLVLAVSMTTQDVRFAQAKDKPMIEIREDDETYTIHFLVHGTGVVRRKGIVNLRSLQQDTPVGDKVHLASKQFTFNGPDEYWEFFLLTPKFAKNPDTLFQVELGLEPLRANEIPPGSKRFSIGPEILHSATWQVRDGRIDRITDPYEKINVQSYFLNTLTYEIDLSTAPVAPAKVAPVAGEIQVGSLAWLARKITVEIVARRVDPQSAVHTLLIAYQPPSDDEKGRIAFVKDKDLSLPKDGNLTLHRYLPSETMVVEVAPGTPAIPSPVTPATGGIPTAPSKAAPGPNSAVRPPTPSTGAAAN